MNSAEIITSLQSKLSAPTGRHLYGILGSFQQLEQFELALAEARLRDSSPFPMPLSVTAGILSSIPDDEFRRLIKDEARRPEPVAAHVGRAFESFLRSSLNEHDVIVLKDFELLFAYRVELQPLRTLAADQNHVIMLLPAERSGNRVIMYPGPDQRDLPVNLIAENHIWEIR